MNPCDKEDVEKEVEKWSDYIIAHGLWVYEVKDPRLQVYVGNITFYAMGNLGLIFFFKNLKNQYNEHLLKYEHTLNTYCLYKRKSLPKYPSA